MPLPLVAILPAAALVTAAGVSAFRRASFKGHRDQKAEDALDALPEGISCRTEDESRNASLRIRRSLQWRGGPKYEFDLAAFGRIRLKRL